MCQPLILVADGSIIKVCLQVDSDSIGPCHVVARWHHYLYNLYTTGGSTNWYSLKFAVDIYNDNISAQYILIIFSFVYMDDGNCCL